MNDLDFSGRTVLVVGGSSGIGNGIARAFLQRGAVVHVWGTRASAADYADASDSSLAGLHYTQIDVADAAQIERCSLPFDRLDVLVQSQGTVLYERQEFASAGFKRVLDVNLTSLMVVAQRCFEPLKAASGAMIIVSSTAAFHATKGNPAYNASKAGAVGLTRTLGQAWAGDGIRVNGIAPGVVDTPMWASVDALFAKHEHLALGEKKIAVGLAVPLGRMGQPDDIAGAAVFLASDEARYITAQTLNVDGGNVMS